METKPNDKSYDSLVEDEIKFWSKELIKSIRKGIPINLEFNKKIQWINYFMIIDRKLNQNGFHGECVEFLLIKR